MSQMNVNGDINMTLERARGEADRQSGLSTAARDLMEQLSPDKILEKLLNIFGILGSALKG